MKQICVILFFILSFVACTNDNLFENESPVAKSAVSTRGAGDEDVDWDWTNPSSYTYAYIEGKGKIPISSPFSTSSSANKDISLIISGKDYLSSQGWVLLDKVFGTETQAAETTYPHFMLYNKYRGIIRLFVFNNNPSSHSSAIVTLNWFGDNRSSLLANNFPYPLPSNSIEAKSADLKVVNYVDDYYSASWFVTDFLTSFDPHVSQNNSKANYALEFKIYSEVKSSVDLKGIMHFETKSSTMLDNSTADINAGSPFEIAGKVLTKLPSGKSITDLVKSINNLTSTSCSGGSKLKDELNKTQSELVSKGFESLIGNVTSAAKNLGGVIGSVAGIVDLFVGKKSAVSTVQIMPMVSEGTTTMTGNITTKTNAARYVLQLPNSNHVYSDGSLNYDGLPIYDKPLGVFCLEEEPQIDRLRVFDSYERRSGDREYNYPYSYYSYIVRGGLKISINKAADVSYVSGVAQLLTPHALSWWAKYDEVVDPLEDGIYMAQFRNDSVQWYGTYPVPLEKFKNTMLLAMDKDVYLKITLVLKVTDPAAEQTPVIVSNLYKLSHIVDRGASGGDWVNPISGRHSITYGTPYEFSHFQTKDNTDQPTEDSNALILNYYDYH